MAAETITRADASPRLRIDFLFLDLTACARCLGADRSIDRALEVVREVLEVTGVEVEVAKTLVRSEEQARALRFASSPTIRIDGHDVARELRESACGSEPCTDGCGDGIACRVWVHQGQEYTEPPVAMVVEAILGRLYGREGARVESGHEPYEMPENLVRFFAARAPSSDPGQSGCCSASEQEACCAADEKEACCAPASAEACGCR